MRTYFSPWQTFSANATKPFLRKPAHPLRLNIGTLQNLPSCFHMSRFKSITSIHCQRPLQKYVNNHIDNRELKQTQRQRKRERLQTVKR